MINRAATNMICTTDKATLTPINALPVFEHGECISTQRLSPMMIANANEH